MWKKCQQFFTSSILKKPVFTWPPSRFVPPGFQSKAFNFCQTPRSKTCWFCSFYQKLDKPNFQKEGDVFNFDTCHCSKSCFSVTTGLISSTKLSVKNSTLVEENADENVFLKAFPHWSSLILFIDPCIRILIVRNFQKLHFYWYVSTFEHMSIRYNRFNFFQKDLNGENCTCWKEPDSDVIYSGQWLGLLIVLKFYKMLIELIHPEIQTFSILTGLIFVIKIRIKNFELVQEFSIGEQVILVPRWDLWLCESSKFCKQLWLFSRFELIFQRNYKFNFVNQSLYQKHYPCRGEFLCKIKDFEPCIRILIIWILLKKLLIT